MNDAFGVNVPVARQNFARFEFLLLSLLAGFAVARDLQAQTNLPNPPTASNSNSEPKSTAQAAVSEAVRAEQTREACIAGRRYICGRVLKVLPEGLVVESGYTNLMRKTLEGNWLLPRTVVASRTLNLVESQVPDSPCVGTVFVTDLPRPRGGAPLKVQPYDYVVLRAYPAGTFSYTSVGDIQRRVRRFSVGLDTAIKLTLQ